MCKSVSCGMGHTTFLLDKDADTKDMKSYNPPEDKPPAAAGKGGKRPASGMGEGGGGRGAGARVCGGPGGDVCVCVSACGPGGRRARVYLRLWRLRWIPIPRSFATPISLSPLDLSPSRLPPSLLLCAAFTCFHCVQVEREVRLRRSPRRRSKTKTLLRTRRSRPEAPAARWCCCTMQWQTQTQRHRHRDTDIDTDRRHGALANILADIFAAACPGIGVLPYKACPMQYRNRRLRRRGG